MVCLYFDNIGFFVARLESYLLGPDRIGSAEPADWKLWAWRYNDLLIDKISLDCSQRIAWIDNQRRSFHYHESKKYILMGSCKELTEGKELILGFVGVELQYFVFIGRGQHQ